MKIILEFDMPDDVGEFRTWHNGENYLSALVEFRDWMRSKRKYGDGFTDTEAWDAFWKTCSENGIDEHL